MEHVGKVMLVPRDRPGWGAAEIDVPCVIRGFVSGTKRKKGTKKTIMPAYYEVDSPYLKVHYPLLAKKLGWAWRWKAVEVMSFELRALLPEDEPRVRRGGSKTKRKKKAFVAPTLTSNVPHSFVNSTVHPLVAESLTPASSAQVAARTRLRSQLYTPATSLLYQLLHKQLMNNISEMGTTILSKLSPSPPKQKKVEKDPEYDPSVGHATVYLEEDVASCLKAVMKAGGFVADDKEEVFTAGTGASVIALLGMGVVHGAFNPLLKTTFFAQRKVHKIVPGALHNPLTATDEEIYAAAEEELGAAAFDEGDQGMLPAWRLRQLIEAKMVEGAIPDWRVAGIAAVDVERPVTVTFKTGTKKVNKQGVSKKEGVTIRFQWQGRSRTQPGKTLMKIRFVSLV